VSYTPGSVARVSLLCLLAVLLQVSGIEALRLGGGSPDLIPLAVAAVALFGGSVPGALSGFAAGLLLDLMLGQNLGASALVLTLIGYGVGRYREVRDPSHGLIALAVAAGATAAYGAGIGLVSFMLEIEADVSALFLRDIVVTTLLNVLIALPVFALVRLLLRPVLSVDPLERRRRRGRSQPRPTGPIGLRGLGRP
jgi:rod shape-determining protein MreD